ncbi:MAG: TatD family hydrolase [Kiritimatiellae bacterium]|nr:TatD family hydrolase [Kiritimatiellia bacterium]
MRLYDTHCHFERADPAEIAAVLARAKAAGVEKLMAVGGSPALNESAALAVEVAAEALVAPKVSCAIGFDREQINELGDAETRSFSSPLRLNQKALGEIGLDYHYSPETREAQLKLFGEQLEEAKRRNLPVVIHTREADDDTLALLREIPSRGIIHCYTGTPEYAKRFLDLGFYISISGIVTFKPADNVRASALVLPDDRILIETDSPFLAPVPLRGTPNEPAFLVHTCEFLAKLRGKSADDFAELTFANAEGILG